MTDDTNLIISEDPDQGLKKMTRHCHFTGCPQTPHQEEFTPEEVENMSATLNELYN
jgi:hypothetical protein